FEEIMMNGMEMKVGCDGRRRLMMWWELKRCKMVNMDIMGKKNNRRWMLWSGRFKRSRRF
ncbi:hypothetical protein, partial [Staphylococcus saprophyticus]|uniref:hypothetical protein n=1 Tax=Staphylococcus saprophyticus TaxID=29385 RepID=UPI001C92E8CD